MDVFEWLETWWDDDVSMLWNPPGSFDGLLPPRTVHLVPPTVWFALGLLARRGPGDVERAVRAVEAVIACQLDEPGTPWHGTFARFREFPPPRPGAAEFVGYDPNWRQFVGSGFCLALRTAGDALPPATVGAVLASVRLAVEGEPPDRVTARYSNIALMRAWLDVEAGQQLDDAELVARGERLAAEIVARFEQHGTLDEWNSPTYYGVDLYAIRLWRRHSASERLRAFGARLEAGLWADLAPWYHAGLGNMAGPYTRAYGMDMRRYVGAVGLWIDGATGPGAGPAPVPDLGGRFSHSHDLSLSPLVGILGTDVPSEPLGLLRTFEGERRLRQVVSSDPERVATAWLSPGLMIGAESGGRRWSGWGQYHPATVHWSDPSGRTRWIRLVHAGPVEATAAPGVLRAVCHPHRTRGRQPTTFLVSAADRLAGDAWRLPGLSVAVRTDARFEAVAHTGQLFEVRYEPPTDTTVFEVSFS